ncbi:MAG: cytochrome c3 family protein [Gemmatimonadota bacterium]
MARLKWIPLGVAGALALAGTGLVAAGAWPFGDEAEQPIAFPHDVHAGGQNQIPCMYCHFSADESPDAGIPPVSVCAGCHLPGSQPGGDAQPLVAGDRPGVQRLTEYWNEGEPIPWVRIHDLPDHVHFPHMIHVNAGLDCEQCHGAVEEMAEIEQVASLEMGWCIDCHQDPPEHVQEAGIEAARIDCFVCHY